MKYLLLAIALVSNFCFSHDNGKINAPGVGSDGNGKISVFPDSSNLFLNMIDESKEPTGKARDGTNQAGHCKNSKKLEGKQKMRSCVFVHWADVYPKVYENKEMGGEEPPQKIELPPGKRKGYPFCKTRWIFDEGELTATCNSDPILITDVNLVQLVIGSAMDSTSKSNDVQKLLDQHKNVYYADMKQRFESKVNVDTFDKEIESLRDKINFLESEIDKLKQDLSE